jgi:FKBP-type peptidyl-prolyl cis-trans isomerase
MSREFTESGASVVVNYEGYFDSVKGTLFDSTISRKQPLTAKLGYNDMLPAWEHALLNMCKG